ncbi:uncharacterized protein LOC101451437 [Ceratitis capitata]|uniref:uncharacterized protein LOC101451437 n=1 Tax=Ceratitis capitata TaxID=7213 RepID=UPI000329BE7C|nr:uncharacterized protein LOC101451437 [Ceratitis capitata]
MHDIKSLEKSAVIKEPDNRIKVQNDGKVPTQPNDTSTIVFVWLVIFSFLMFTFPFIAFYGVRSWLRESFDISEFYVNCWAVLSSVFVVNVIICLYVYKAVSEENSVSVPEKPDKKNT